MERHFSILPQEINGRSLAFFMLHRFVASRRRESRDRNEAPAPIAPEAEPATAGGTSPAAEAVTTTGVRGFGPAFSSEDWCSFRTNT
jgi:hypothetical protein